MNYVQMLFYYLFSTLNFYIAGTVAQDRTFSKRRKVCFLFYSDFGVFYCPVFESDYNRFWINRCYFFYDL